ncbi:hypothetical protein BVC80_1183g2 [Macleaya cordata]|uniref:Uncharacterized protein n=1 Tax=Macleaya cordata TaxID=56857 RepID=A0A200PQ28_MACCD|nr:hypothetical protein BVC80_1183g2 [Macleaya cordata]
MEQVLQRQAPQESSSEDDDYGLDDAFSQVTGYDRGGRVCCYRNAAKPKKIWRGESSSAATRRNAEEVVSLRANVGSLEQLLKQTMDRLDQIEGANGGVNNSSQDHSEDTQSPASQ